MQNKCLKDSSVLEGLAETQQSQYKPDVSQQVLGGECVRSWYESAEEGLPLTILTEQQLRKAGAGPEKTCQQKD